MAYPINSKCHLKSQKVPLLSLLVYLDPSFIWIYLLELYYQQL